MNKKGITILLILNFFVIFFLQTNFFHKFTISGIMPNLFIIYVLFIALFTNSYYGVGFGLMSGLIIDLQYSKVIGITSIMLCIIGYLGAYFDKNFSKENKLTIIIMIGLSTIFYEIGNYFLNCVILEYDAEIWQFIKILLIETLYNVLISIIIYPLFQKIGYAIERKFKHNNILTRYF